MSLRIRLLGPVEVQRNGRVTPLNALKRISLLAVLAFNCNQPVSVEDVREALWTGEPPRSASANLRNYTSTLRQVVGDRITSHSGTYQLTLHQGELDVEDFRVLAARGRAALAANNYVTADAALADALALWRGSAVHGLLPSTALSVDLVSLEQQRLAVFEDLVQARLSLGEHSRVVIDLRRLLQRHPLRERAWAQLMFALYRTGDTAGAVEAFAAARAALKEELGVEPGPKLSSLHRAILSRSPDLAAVFQRASGTSVG